jgi:hypothetical protein
MSLLERFFPSSAPNPRKDGVKTDLEEYKEKLSERQVEAEAERDRTARIVEYVRCTQQGKDDCRMGISWEELAAESVNHG